MSQIYLAINHGSYEGWALRPYDSPSEALQAAQEGDTYGSEWLILKELAIVVQDPKKTIEEANFI